MCFLGLPQRFDLDKKRKIVDFVATPKQNESTENGVSNLESKSVPAIKTVSDLSGGNAEEARQLRHVMGFAKGNVHSKTSFAFGFSEPASIAEAVGDSLSVFVGGMPYTWTPDEVCEFWSECGEITNVNCMKFHDSGRFKGIAKITFKTEDGHKAALECDGETWDGFTFVVTKWKEKNADRTAAPQTQTKTQSHSTKDPIGTKVDGFNVLFMCNLPRAMTQDDIAQLFEAFDIEAVRLKMDSETGISKGYAHIHFIKDDQLESAIEKMDKMQIQGRTVRLGYAVPPPNWKPKSTKHKRESVPGSGGFTSEDFKTPDGRYLMRLSGLLPAMAEDDIRKLFSDVTLEDVVLIWSSKKQQSTGACYLVVHNAASVTKALKKDNTFHQGRRLHIRPGKFSDYTRKAKRPKKKKATTQTPQNAPIDDDDPLMSLL